MTTVITGASRGIGRAVALKMAKEGPVILVATPASEKKLIELADEINRSGGNADIVVGDVGGLTTAKSVTERLEKLGWTVKNLILNAGISKGGPATGTPVQVFEDVFQTNFYGSLYFIKEFVPGMVSRGTGTVVLLTGAAAVKGYRGMGAYCASKHALLGLARSLAAEVNSKGVSVVPLCPGPVDTDMTAPIVDIFVKKGMTVEAAKQKIAEANGQKALLTVEKVAETVAELCAKTTVFSGEPVII